MEKEQENDKERNMLTELGKSLDAREWMRGSDWLKREVPVVPLQSTSTMARHLVKKIYTGKIQMQPMKFESTLQLIF